MSNARNQTYALLHKLNRAGIDADFDQAHTLRRAQLTLHTWAEQECGDSNNRASWAIERDEETGKPYRCIYPHTGKSYRKSYRQAIPDREAGALRRVAEVCEALGAHYYHQGDPRGCALYVSAEPLDDQNYSTRGVACIGE